MEIVNGVNGKNGPSVQKLVELVVPKSGNVIRMTELEMGRNVLDDIINEEFVTRSNALQLNHHQ